MRCHESVDGEDGDSIVSGRVGRLALRAHQLTSGTASVCSLPLVAFLAAALLVAAGPGSAVADEPSFSRQIVPLLYKLGCSAGECHGSFADKGGLQLSLFASRPDVDFQAIRYGGFGRRLNRERPEESLLVMKPTGSMPHGGGRRFLVGSSEYNLLLNWISSGALYNPERELQVQTVRIEPASFALPVGAEPLPLKVLARLSDGSESDVTRYSRFESHDPAIVSVNDASQAVAHVAGDVAVLAHYAGEVAFTIAAVPSAIPLPPDLTFPEEPLADPVDRAVVEKLRRLNIVPSPLCDDSEFLRRAYLDTTSTLPTAEEVRQFLADPAPDKRARLVDRLLEHPLHAAVWATRLCDMLGADDRFLSSTQFHDWFRNKFERNVPWDEIAYGVLCATAADDREPEQILADQKRIAEEKKLAAEAAKNKDPKQEPPPVDPNAPRPWQVGYGTRKTLDVLYSSLKFQQQIRDIDGKELKRITDSKLIALQTANALLGVQLACAQCHKHPYDRWTQNDFFSFATVFAHVQISGVDPLLKAQNVNLGGIHVLDKPAETFDDPVTRTEVSARPLGGPVIDVKPGVDPRHEVWKSIVAAQNQYFARSIVNRIWAHYMGRGLFEPVDAQSAANPPSHPEVLDDLARDLIAHKYDLRHLHRRILNTVTYQRSWKANVSNSHDERNFSHRSLRRLTAEQMLDAIVQISGTALKLEKAYGGEIRPGSRVPEITLSRYRGDDAYVLQVFGKPLRVQTCDCERSSAPSLSQALYLYNDALLLGKLTDESGRVKKLVNEQPDDGKLLEELYLATLARLPTGQESERSLAHITTAKSRLEGFQDILWSLFNRQEFIANH